MFFLMYHDVKTVIFNPRGIITDYSAAFSGIFRNRCHFCQMMNFIHCALGFQRPSAFIIDVLDGIKFTVHFVPAFENLAEIS